MKSKSLAVFWSLIFISSYCHAQYYDGHLDMVGRLGFEPGKTSYLLLGADAGLGKFISIGMNLKYLTSYEKPTHNPFALPIEVNKFNYSLRANIHAYNILKLNKTDILVGYNYTPSTSGLHGEYRFFFNEFFAIYGRGIYNLKRPLLSTLSSINIGQKLRFEIGIIFKTISGNKYNNSDW